MTENKKQEENEQTNTIKLSTMLKSTQWRM